MEGIAEVEEEIFKERPKRPAGFQTSDRSFLLIDGGLELHFFDLVAFKKKSEQPYQ
ncbi:hypothetical protein SAMN04488104_102810 [Algoriphagus faecimaris]|uniref:Uncharacterized protein n=1 Tax=Algoriphagus faecimaris TaxID=686796 RepID=A0A1G6UEQ6_9BACT|nr:hypothetical protein SAMN04488104_102810 [Algoriphagus faecimaris]